MFPTLRQPPCLGSALRKVVAVVSLEEDPIAMFVVNLLLGSEFVAKWNHVFLVACLIAMFLDPLYFCVLGERPSPLLPPHRQEVPSYKGFSFIVLILEEQREN